MIKIFLPRQLINYTTLEGEFESQATTVQSALDELVNTFPFLNIILFNSDRTLRNFISVFLNDHVLHDLNITAPPNSCIHIIAAVAGG